MNSNTIPLAELQPTQLYISRLKLAHAQAYLEACDYTDYTPLPVKQIGRVLFLTDGHTRALLLWRAGHTTIKTIPDEDDMEWASYLENVAWCREVGIRTIADLDCREVDEEQYQVLWRDRCERAHDNMEARTRRFYAKLGFVALEELTELWDENNPCLYLICDLGER